jgi:hypothetical protein
MEHPSYEHRYRYRKVEEPMDFRTFRNLVKKARLSIERESYLWLSYLSGARKLSQGTVDPEANAKPKTVLW